MTKNRSTPPGLVNATQAANVVGVTTSYFLARYADQLKSWQDSPGHTRLFDEAEVERLGRRRRYTRLIEKLERLAAGPLLDETEDFTVVECHDCGSFAVLDERDGRWLCEAGHGASSDLSK